MLVKEELNPIPKSPPTLVRFSSPLRLVKEEFPFIPKSRGHEAGATFTNKVRLFGFYAAKEGKDGDHVWEIQVGGPDSVENMWPLESKLNQSAGGELERATVKDPKNKTVKMKDLKKTARKNVSKGKKMWIKVKI